jgi:uncharacterized repeat protein (TIGR01451 family)
MNFLLKTTKYFTVLSLLLMGSFLFGAQASAQSVVDINFEIDPLFKELNVLPGSEDIKWVKVKNNSNENQPIAVYADYHEDFDDLGSQMKIVISSGPDIYYDEKLSDFFSANEIYLSDISVGIEKQYNFAISFLHEATNDYQGKTLKFNITIGTQSKESVGDEGGGGGRGGGYIYSDLIITNESVTVNNAAATVGWHTNKLATSRVIYDTVSHPDLNGGMSPNYGYASSTVEDTNKINPHSVVIYDLEPMTVYYFRPVSKASPEKYGEELSFVTTDNAEDVLVLGVEGAPDLLVNKSCKVKMANPGDKVIYQVKIENKGFLTAYNVILNDILPDGFRYSDTLDGQKSWNLGNIKEGEFNTIEYSVVIDDSISDGKYSNIAKVRADNFGQIEVKADLEISSVIVLGIELIDTGFSIAELVLIVGALLIFIVLSLFLRKKLRM